MADEQTEILKEILLELRRLHEDLIEIKDGIESLESTVKIFSS
jgi:Ni,Fe-hydrogenase III large subunit